MFFNRKPEVKKVISCSRHNRSSFFITSLFLCASLFPSSVLSNEYAAIISQVDIDTDSQRVNLNFDIEFRLSPIAKEALQKGIALTWATSIKLKKQGWLWNTTVEEGEIRYIIKNHALLDLYSVSSQGVSDMFSTLRGALNAMSKNRDIPIIDKKLLQTNEKYHVMIKVIFDREALPIPLRPLSYFDSQWALSSQWTRWPLLK